MRNQNNPIIFPSGTVSCSKISAIHTKSIYANDMGMGGPVADKYRNRIRPNSLLIQVGYREKHPFGELRCYRRGNKVVVGVYKKDRTINGRELYFTPDDKSLLKKGAKIPEAVFTVQVSEFIGTPWHEINRVSIWTVAGLRKNGECEFFKDK